MFDDMPKQLHQIRSVLGHDCYQLLTVEEPDDFSQIKAITKIAESLLNMQEFKECRFFISENPHDFGSYYGLEISYVDFENCSDIEDQSIITAEELGYDV